MWKDNVTLIAALIAASTSTGNAVLSSRSATSLESKKWEQARLDQAAANLRLAVADFAKELATASERAMWLTWTAENDSEGLSERELRAYEEDIRVVMPKLFSAQTLVAAHDEQAYNKLTVLVQRLYNLDNRIGRASLVFRRSRPEGLKALQALRKETLDFANSLPAELVNTMTGASPRHTQ